MIATVVDGLPPGVYVINVTGVRAGSPVAPISTDVLVWDRTTMTPTR